MKSDKNILIAFILNLTFSIFEFFGGLFTNSVAILSDAIHDIGDAMSIGLSYFLEKKSKKKPDNKYTYGYIRYSIIGSVITTVILILGSIFVIYNAICRILNPMVINYDGMIIFGIVGVIVNFGAVYFTREGNSLNQRAVNLHMIEDILGWIIVLIGAIIMKFTDIKLIDPILSILVALFILKNSFRNLKTVMDLFLEKTPNDISIDELKKHICEIKGVVDVHHIHVWSMDGVNNYATMHIVTDLKDVKELKHKVKEELKEHGISHSTIEIEEQGYECDETECTIETEHHHGHHHHHHHH